MTDTVSMGQFTDDQNTTAFNQPRWTLTIGQLSANREHYSTVASDYRPKRKNKKPRFAFLKISANAHLAHLKVVSFWLLKKIQPKTARPPANQQKSQIPPTTKDCG